MKGSIRSYNANSENLTLHSKALCQQRNWKFRLGLTVPQFAKLASFVTTLAVASIIGQPVKAATLEFFDHDNFLNSAGSITVIGFDDLPTGNGVLSGNEFSSQGLAIIQRDSLPINVLTGEDIDLGFPSNVNSAPNVISSSFVLGGFNNANSDNFDFLLANPSFSAGLWIGNIGSGGNDTTEVQFLDSFGEVIASEIISSANRKNLIAMANCEL